MCAHWMACSATCNPLEDEGYSSRGVILWNMETGGATGGMLSLSAHRSGPHAIEFDVVGTSFTSMLPLCGLLLCGRIARNFGERSSRMP